MYHIKAKVSIDGCKRERYLLKIKEMEVEIADTYDNLQEEERLFSANPAREGTRIETIKDLLLKVKTLEESKDRIATELKQKEKVWMKDDEGRSWEFGCRFQLCFFSV